MNDFVLSVAEVSKVYPMFRSNLSRFARWFGADVKPTSEFIALNDVSFNVRRGEAVALLGRNGAGKSTLLKVITGTVRPSKGTVNVQGRVSAILELGLGFNPDFTGRENVRHSGGLLGYSSAEIETAMPAIESFAGIGDFFDQPLRMYSSGMQARLAFALATASTPDILIIDEAIAVGDAAFQRQCFRRIEEFIAKGCALLFVSHDTDTIKKICTRGLCLVDGALVIDGSAKEVADHYEKMVFGRDKPVKSSPSPKASFDAGLSTQSNLEYGDGRAIIEDIRLLGKQGEQVNMIPAGEEFSLCYKVRAISDLDHAVLAFMIKTKEGVAVYGTDTRFIEADCPDLAAGGIAEVGFLMRGHLAPGVYYLNCGIRDGRGGPSDFIHRQVDVATFRITASPSTTAAAGVAEVNAKAAINMCNG